MTKRRLLNKAVALALFGGCITSALAQEVEYEEDSIEVIEVTGLRQSLAASIAIKQESNSFVEVVSAEDIGKLPDVSIAESLSRLPGLAGQRVNGRVQVISIRGMGPDFTTTLLNGRQQASSGDNRAPEYDQYPSELINGAVVYKTADSAVVGMGLAGTVDLQTIRPLTHGKQNVVVNLRGESSDIGQVNSDVDNKGWRGSFSYIDQFADNTIGVALGFSHTDTPTQIQTNDSWWWEAEDEEVIGTEHAAALVLKGQSMRGTSRSQVRDGVLGVFEWQPNEDTHTVIDAYYSKFAQEETFRSLSWFSNSTADNGETRFESPVFADFGSTEVLQSGIATNINPIINNSYNARDDKLLAVGINNETFFGNWLFTTDLSYSSSKRKEQVTETYAGSDELVDIAFDLVQEGYSTYTEGTDYADVNQIKLGDPGGWGHDGAIRYPEVEETVKSVSFKADYDLFDSSFKDIFSHVVFGADYTKRSKEKDVFENDLFLKNQRENVLVDPKYIVDSVDIGFAGLGGALSYNVNDVIDNYYLAVPINDDNHWNKAWTVDEEITTFYAKLNIDTEVVNLPLVGNLGVQYITTKQMASGFTIETRNGVNDPAPVSQELEHSYDDLLPSLSLKLEIADSQFVRLSAGKYLARARMDEMRASSSASVGIDFLWSGYGGNPNLEPWRTDAIDIGYEYYFSTSSYAGLTYFHKNLESYIYNGVTETDFSGLPNESGIEPTSNIGNMSQPINGKGGTIDGLELSFVLDAELISESLAGFGLIGSYSWTESNIEPNGPGSGTDLPGLSEEVRNLTAYYEKDGFSARISQRYRSEFLGEVPQLFATRGFTSIAADQQIDAQISYDLEDGTLAGTTFLFQINNLSNSPYVTTSGTTLGDGAPLPNKYEEYGRQFLFGVNYKY